MKKSAIAILLCLTLAFATFVAGFYVGRNYNHSSIQISGILPNADPLSGSSTQQTGATTVPATLDAQTMAIMDAINAATLEELDQVPNIGRTYAENIINYRNSYGDFEKPEDLMHVDGIGEKRMNSIIEYFRGRINNEDTGS